MLLSVIFIEESRSVFALRIFNLNYFAPNSKSLLQINPIYAIVASWAPISSITNNNRSQLGLATNRLFVCGKLVKNGISSRLFLVSLASGFNRCISEKWIVGNDGSTATA